MKLRKVDRPDQTRYPSFEDYRAGRRHFLKHLAGGAAFLAASGMGLARGLAEQKARLGGFMAKPQPQPKPAPAETVKATKLTDGQVKQAEALVAKLGDRDFKTREKAQVTLFAMGTGVVAVLEKHKESDDAEIRERVAGLLKRFKAAKVITERPALGGKPMPPKRPAIKGGARAPQH